MILDVAEANGNIDADKVMRALSGSTKRLISSMYMKPGMGDGGACHPRDNIALSFLSENLNLGYDIFNYIMFTREQQASNLAVKLTSYKNPIVILGKSYKPNVELYDGSYSLLVGHFIELEGRELFFDKNPSIEGPFTYLIGHRNKFYNFDFYPGSIIIDPWGDFPEIKNCKVVKYGYRK
jgi:UDPglucose 6-dehydrogenase